MRSHPPVHAHLKGWCGTGKGNGTCSHSKWRTAMLTIDQTKKNKRKGRIQWARLEAGLIRKRKASRPEKIGFQDFVSLAQQGTKQSGERQRVIVRYSVTPFRTSRPKNRRPEGTERMGRDTKRNTAKAKWMRFAGIRTFLALLGPKFGGGSVTVRTFLGKMERLN